MMRKSQEIFNLPLIAILEGKEVGKVKDAVIDPRNKAIAGLIVEDSEWHRSLKVIPFSSIRSIGDDAIIIDGQKQLTDLLAAKDLEYLLREDIRLLDAKVFDVAGKSLGRVAEFFLDTTTGKILGCEVCQTNSAQPIMVTPGQMVTLGKQILIVEKEAANWEEKEDSTVGRVSLPSRQAGIPAKETMPAKEASPPRPKKSEEASPETTEKAESSEGTSAPTKVGDDRRVVPEEAEKSSKEKGVRKVLEERQDAYLVGKEVEKDILFNNGEILIRCGETISPEVIEKAKETDKYLALTFAVRRN